MGSFKSSTNTIPTELPKVTGNGPFLEPLKFNVVGSPSSLLDIKLPASAVLNLRLNNKTSIVGINGQLDNLTNEVSMMSNTFKPIIYQRIFNASPLSLMVSNHLNFHNFVVLNVQSGTWNIKDSSLVAWYGSNISSKLSNKLLDSFNTLEASGEGVLALKGTGHIFKIDLAEGESMLVNPNNLIAYNTNNIAITKLETKLINLKLPALSVPENAIVIYHKLLNQLKTLLQIQNDTPKDTKENSYFKKFNDYLKTRQANKSSDKLLKLNGPVTLVIQNNI